MRVGPCMVLIWDGKIRRAFMVCEKYQAQYLFKLQGGKYSKWKCWSSLQTWISKHETNLELIGYSTYHSILHLLEPFRGVSAKGLIFRTIYICRASEDWKKMSLWKKSILLKPSTFGLSFVVEPKSIHFQAQKHHHITTTHTYKQHTIIIRICLKKKTPRVKRPSMIHQTHICFMSDRFVKVSGTPGSGGNVPPAPGNVWALYPKRVQRRKPVGFVNYICFVDFLL